MMARQRFVDGFLTRLVASTLIWSFLVVTWSAGSANATNCSVPPLVFAYRVSQPSFGPPASLWMD